MILGTGAGTVGRQVVEQLVADDQPVRAVARDLDRAGVPEGVELPAEAAAQQLGHTTAARS
jgi:uncharacterized protein YbjT (DUF2867 family)